MSGLTLFIIKWKGSFLALILWQFTLMIFNNFLVPVCLGLVRGDLEGDELYWGGPGDVTDVRDHMSLSDLLTWSPESPSNELDVLADLLLNKPVLMFNRPHLLHIQTVVFCPRRLYSSLVMPMQFVCSHLSHPSHCSTSQVHVTSKVNIAQGKSANEVGGPGFSLMSPAS